MNTVKTPKGTELPLVNLKGKAYLQVAHRLIWFNEDNTNFNISTEFLQITDEQTVAKTTVTVKDKDGNIIKSAQATKRETKKDFSDHTEKAETGSLGRALAQLGYGTQFALADLDEGDRIVDSPMPTLSKAAKETTEAPSQEKAAATSAKPKVSFRKLGAVPTAVVSNAPNATVNVVSSAASEEEVSFT